MMQFDCMNLRAWLVASPWWCRALLPLAVLLLAGCVESLGRDGFLRRSGDTRAAFELKCPLDRLTLVEINDRTMGVEGCGQRAVYTLRATGRYHSDWLRD
jgi:hypothetical protein